MKLLLKRLKDTSRHIYITLAELVQG